MKTKKIHLLLLIIFLTKSLILFGQTQEADYERISKQLNKNLSINELIVKSAELLTGMPYVSGTLDESDTEKLIINFKKFDCVTFQETCAALALDKKSENPSFENFKNKLENLRYKNGKLAGYGSRLHYSSIWINDNIKRGNVKDLSAKLGGVKLSTKVNFMSSHSEIYKHLKNNVANISAIKQIENEINLHPVFYIEKNKIQSISNQIPSGALIFITTSKSGLDFAHVGIAVQENGVLKMIHASSTGKKTMKTPGALSSYLNSINNFTGISVLELN